VEESRRAEDESIEKRRVHGSGRDGEGALA
jgi:hypothetical protein